MLHHFDDYLAWMQLRHYAASTIIERRKMLSYFHTYLLDRDAASLESIDTNIIKGYQQSLFDHRKPNGAPLSRCCQRDRLVCVRQFFRYLLRQGIIERDPTLDTDLPKYVRPLPRNILTPSEAEQVLRQPKTHTHLGIRDRAILELLYSSGLRRSEIVHLHLTDIDHARGMVLIRQGKGGKDRVVPIGSRALYWIQRYIVEVRLKQLQRAEDVTLFQRPRGGVMHPQRVTDLAARYIRQAKLPSGKAGAAHTFRHTMATVMLEAGADIRYIQSMLGHAKLSSTQIYTHVSQTKLKEIHRRYHPANGQQAA